MSKTFYTQRDIQELHDQGVTRLHVGSGDVVLTDLAREQAHKLGLLLVYDDVSAAATPAQSGGSLVERVRAAVRARLGADADPLLVEKAVARVLSQLEA